MHVLISTMVHSYVSLISSGYILPSNLQPKQAITHDLKLFHVIFNVYSGYSLTPRNKIWNSLHIATGIGILCPIKAIISKGVCSTVKKVQSQEL